jgi:hypothetical protein
MTVRLELKMLIDQCYKSSVACNKLACFFSKIIESSYQGTIVGLLDQVELEAACGSSTVAKHSSHDRMVKAGNTKGGSITVQLTSCLTGLESAVRLLTIFVFICKTD